MIDQRAKDSFWGAVEDCLVEFHGIPAAAAHQKAAALRATFDQPPPGISGEVVYHDEPFEVACDIADNHLDLSKHFTKYELILARHNW